MDQKINRRSLLKGILTLPAAIAASQFSSSSESVAYSMGCKIDSSLCAICGEKHCDHVYKDAIDHHVYLGAVDQMAEAEDRRVLEIIRTNK